MGRVEVCPPVFLCATRASVIYVFGSEKPFGVCLFGKKTSGPCSGPFYSQVPVFVRMLRLAPKPAGVASGLFGFG